VDIYKENDNPPLDVLNKLVDAKMLGIFDSLYVAYPMIGRKKMVDPIFLGVIENTALRLRENSIIRFDDMLAIEKASEKYFGELFEIGRWL